MSKPPINPDKTVSGIAVDPQTLERVIPESKRPDGTRTPKAGSKQAQMDATSLPKGHIIGWAPPPTSNAAAGAGTKPLSKSAKKNAKRKEKREEKKEEPVPENWDDDEQDVGSNIPDGKTEAKVEINPENTQPSVTSDRNVEAKLTEDELTSQLEKMNVK
ncbi:hypothetical protein BD779DRAFT_1667444 [Infundibulicybe gibba]|nr:hypothetical protein BD779DRAFT_1667444 [Infundibulicybe gibba]